MLGIAGCTGGGDGGDDSSSSSGKMSWTDEEMSLVTAPEHPELLEPSEWEQSNRETVAHLTWSSYQAENVQGPFREQFNANTRIDLFVDMPKAINRLNAGGWKTFNQGTFDMGFLPTLVEEGLVRPMDLESWRPYSFDHYTDQWNPDSGYKYAFIDEETYEFSEDGQLYGIPQRWGWVSWMVNTDEVDEEDYHNYDAAWMPDKYDIGVNDAQWQYVTQVVLMRAGIHPFEEHTESDLETYREKLTELFKGAKAVLPSWGATLQAMKAGEIDITIYSFNALASSLRKDTGDTEKWKCPVPEPVDGLKMGSNWVETTVMLKGNHPRASDNYLAYLQKPEVAAELMWPEKGILATVPQQAAIDQLDDSQKQTLDADYWDTALDRSLFFTGIPDLEKFEPIYREVKSQHA